MVFYIGGIGYFWLEWRKIGVGLYLRLSGDLKTKFTRRIKMKSTKTLWAVLMLALVLFLPFIPALAQEDEAGGGAGAAAEAAAEPTVETAPAPAKASPAAPKASPAQQTSLEGTIGSLISKIVAMLAPIGGIFGQAAGFRIGGTTGTGIAALIIAKMLEDKLPTWAKYALYAGGGTMFAGGGANIAQEIIKGITM